MQHRGYSVFRISEEVHVFFSSGWRIHRFVTFLLNDETPFQNDRWQ